MDYSDLNNYLNQINIEETKNNEQIEAKYNEYNIPINNNSIKERNNNIILNRELLLNNNINYSLQIANPQRLNTIKKDRNNNNVNDKINKYKFNNIERPFNPDNSINKMRIPTVNYEYDKNSINNKIKERGLQPSKSVNKSI